jgi:hypothetical protein
MTNDPVQQLIDAGAIPAHPFAPNSRYAAVALAIHRRDASDPGTPYVLRRFIAQRRDVDIASEHIVQSLERPDSIAAQALGDPELYWRVADANAVTDPFELTDTPGERILLPLPPAL